MVKKANACTESDKHKSNCPQKKTILEKFLLAFVTFLLISLVLMSYLFVNEKQKNRFHLKEHKRHPQDGSKICTEENCVSNAADLLQNMDQTVDPCDDFYSFACGGYEKSTSIPSSLKSIHVLRQLQEENTIFLKRLIENPNLRAYYSKNIPVTKAFGMYDTCMDVNQLDRIGIFPLKKLIKDIGDSKITSKEWDTQKYNVYDAIIQTKRSLNFDLFFRIGVWINPKNSSRHAFFIYNANLELKSSSYLPNKTPEDEKLRYSYREYMVNMMKSIGVDQSDVEVQMKEVYKLEKRLAKIYVRFSSSESSQTIAELSKFTKFDWLAFLRKLTADMNYFPTNDDTVLVQSPNILKQTMNILKYTKKHILSNFIAWKIVRGSIQALPTNYSRINQRFHNNIQNRATEEPKRWQTCIQILSEALKMALNYLYVDQRFSEKSRQMAYDIFQGIRNEFVKSLPDKTWMDSITKREAKEKANAINFLVGYNDDLKSSQKLGKVYEEFRVDRTNFFQSYLNQRSFQFKNNVKKIFSPVRKNSFEELTSNANAYYSRQENKISFMAGILQRPFYDMHNSRASNYGSLGMFVGHELTHAFDNNGHKYDKNGELKNWWTKFSLDNFRKKTKCFIEQYDKFAMFGEYVRGENTLSENIADNGGLKLAYAAFKRSQEINGEERRLPGLNLTNDQIFFLSFAQSWCSKYTKDGVKEIINYRVPMMFRVTGTLRNSVEFAQAYRCSPGAKMNPTVKCSLW